MLTDFTYTRITKTLVYINYNYVCVMYVLIKIHIQKESNYENTLNKHTYVFSILTHKTFLNIHTVLIFYIYILVLFMYT